MPQKVQPSSAAPEAQPCGGRRHSKSAAGKWQAFREATGKLRSAELAIGGGWPRHPSKAVATAPVLFRKTAALTSGLTPTKGRRFIGLLLYFLEAFAEIISQCGQSLWRVSRRVRIYEDEEIGVSYDER